jgi:hypothetical protein
MTGKRITGLAIWLLGTLFSAPTAWGKIIYVDADAPDVHDGSSWADAYNYLQDAFADAHSSPKPVEIRVAQGIYRPDRGADQTLGDREATFRLINDLSIRGGYAGLGAPDPNARNVDLYRSILSGDLNGDDVVVADPCDLHHHPMRAENSYHVVTSSDVDTNAVLDGFTITGGNANSPTQGLGGGVYNTLCDGSAPAIINCTFNANSANSGGGMCNDYCWSPTIANCDFSGNFAHWGGGMSNFGSRSTITDCMFSENLATERGGGISNTGRSASLTGCKFNGNSAEIGGGMYNGDCGSNLSGCTFSVNLATKGGGMYNNESAPRLNDCVFNRNSAQTGGGMYSADSFHILTGCIFSGNLADGGGGGMYNESYGDDCEPILTNCMFSLNSAGGDGGGMYNKAYEDECNPILTNCTFSMNSAGEGGGGMYNNGYEDECNPIVTNCTFSNNSANNGVGGIANAGDYGLTLTNCILWNDSPKEIDGVPLITYSNVQGGWPGEGNIDADPCFVDPQNGDYHLKSQAGRWDPNSETWVTDTEMSRCVDAGDPDSYWAGELWPHGKRVNMGAYGGSPQASLSLSDVGNIADLNSDDCVDYNDMILLANKWLYDAFLLPEDLGRDGEVGFKDFAIFANNWQAITLHKFNLDADPEWSTEGEWAFGRPTGGGGAHGNPDPTGGYTGTNVYGVNLSGDYGVAVGGPYYLTAGPFDCSFCNNVKLKFARWLNIDYASYTGAKVEVSNDNISWGTVWEHTEETEIVDNAWKIMEYDISNTADNREHVYIRWSYEIIKSDALPFSGWNIDDIQVGAIPSAPMPPIPNPMTWATKPYATSSTTIAMEATDAVSTDGSGVEYYFEDFHHPAYNSGWLLSGQTWEDQGLSPSTQYSYRVKARNKGNLMETGWSEVASAMTFP